MLIKRIVIMILVLIPAVLLFSGCSDVDLPQDDLNNGIGGAGDIGSEEDLGNVDTEDGSKEEEPSREIQAYILKIDGEDVAYLSSKTELEELCEMLEEEKRALLEEADAEIIEVAVASELTLDESYCLPEDIKSAEEAAEIFIENGGKISFSVTVDEKVTKYISFETVYQNSSSYYEGARVVKTEGVKGEALQTYRVTYLDDSEVTRELVSEKTVKKPVNKVVLLGTKKSTASTGSYRWPTQSVYVTSYYGPRMLRGKYDYHIGIDLRAATGTNIYAADGGKVTYTGYLGSYGYLIKVQHDNGDETYYAHLSKISVKVGERVYKGQVIAKSGVSGNVTGPHLHFEIRKNGKTVNPINYLPKV